MTGVFFLLKGEEGPQGPIGTAGSPGADVSEYLYHFHQGSNAKNHLSITLCCC